VDLLMPLGEYSVTVEVGETRLTGAGRIAKTQGWSLGQTPQVIR
jgi:hypothetical protein